MRAISLVVAAVIAATAAVSTADADMVKKHHRAHHRHHTRNVGILAPYGAARLTVHPTGRGEKVGLLECTVAPHVGFLIAGTQKLNCKFTANWMPEPEFYVADLNVFGADVGFTTGGRFTWAVFAPTINMFPGSLAGNYGGVTAKVAIGVGLGSDFLLGGSSNTVALQPWSVEGITGLNVAAGLSGLQLRSSIR